MKDGGGGEFLVMFLGYLPSVETGSTFFFGTHIQRRSTITLFCLRLLSHLRSSIPHPKTDSAKIKLHPENIPMAQVF